ncbi:MAG: SDR family oxidoreductase [Acidobacteriota bacterium]|jgi:short-subunit dehydrogenase
MRKIALVTGASAGIGLELARLLARHRHDVVLVARREERLREIAAEIEADTGVTTHVIAADLAAEDGARRLYGEVRSRGIEVEYLVNNAGFGTFGPFAETEPDKTMDLVRVNISALTELTALFLPHMVERHSGRVLNVASAAAFQPGPLMATYYASKAYVLHFSEALNEELEGSGVSVTALCPGPVRTEFQQVAGMESSGLVQGKRLISVEAVAESGYEAMMRGKAMVIPGLANRLLAFGVRFAPRRFVTKFVHRMQADRAD